MLHSTALMDSSMEWVCFPTLLCSIAGEVCHLPINIIGQRNAYYFTTAYVKEERNAVHFMDFL